MKRPSQPRLTRRSLFKGGGAALAAGSAGTVAGAVSAQASERRLPITASTAATVEALERDGRLVVRPQTGSRVIELADPVVAARQLGAALLDQPSGAPIRVQDPSPAEAWRPGQEAVLVEVFADGAWRISDVQRMYRRVEEATVLAREGNVLQTSAGELRITVASQPRESDGGYVAAPLAEIGSGDVVGGIVYAGGEERDCWLPVVQLGRQPGA